jgi:hypothetical protein
MPLLDHFHPPLHPVRHWEAFHSRWASAIADALNEDLLPPDYFAEPETHAAGRAALVMPAVFPGHFRVRVFRAEGGSTLVAAIELVSPANKDRAEQRTAFVTKCASYLYEGVGLIIVDVVTSRHANLHNELVGLMQPGHSYDFGDNGSLYAAAYRPVRRGESEQIEVWPATLALGENLPTLPLFLAGDLCVPLDLEATYSEACRRLRL